jgi:predicted deacylase
MNLDTLFPNTYEESRSRFRNTLNYIQTMWQTAQLRAQRIGTSDDLSVDWITAEPTTSKEKLLVFTTGEHGVEGYTGSASLQLFIEDYLARLDPATTGLLLIHAINPWGMKHKRRTNQTNVDLNRNFLWNAKPDPGFNPDYAKLKSLLIPQKPIRVLAAHQAAFVARLLWYRQKFGTAFVRHTTLLGQYAFPQGLFFGGTDVQPEVRLTMQLYRETMRQYDRIVHLDMHSGYGPRYQMQLVNSKFETMDSHALEKLFNFPLVSKANPSEFYEIRGDMIDFVYQLARHEFPNKKLYSTSFEYGTIGNSYSNTIDSLKIKAMENRAHWFGADASARRQIAFDFDELYTPREIQWRTKAMADAAQAFDGILRAEGYLQ